MAGADHNFRLSLWLHLGESVAVVSNWRRFGPHLFGACIVLIGICYAFCYRPVFPQVIFGRKTLVGPTFWVFAGAKSACFRLIYEE